MNYFEELKKFYANIEEIGGMKPSTVAIWHALMYLCNKQGKTRIQISYRELQSMCGMKSNTLNACFDELIKAGRLYIDRNTRPLAYRVITFEEEENTKKYNNHIPPKKAITRSVEFKKQQATEPKEAKEPSILDLMDKVLRRI